MAKVDNLRDIESVRSKAQQAKQELRRFELQERRLCNHRNCGKLESVRDTKRYIQDKNKYPETAVICPNCGEIFDLNPISQKDVDDVFFKLTSMLNQIQLVADLNVDDNERIITDGFESLDKLQTFRTYYLNMVRKLQEGKKNNGPKNSRKGGYGITSTMFSGR